MGIIQIIEVIESELSQIEVQLVEGAGSSSLCSLEKKNQMTASIKYLEGQQQGFRSVLKHLRAKGSKNELGRYIEAEMVKHEKMVQGPLGKSLHWQAYANGHRFALEKIEKITNTLK